MIAEYILLAVLLLAAIFIIVAVLFQRSSDEGLSSTVVGGSETFYGKDKSVGLDKKLKKWTMIVGIIFAVAVVAVYELQPDYANTKDLTDAWLDVSEYGDALK